MLKTYQETVDWLFQQFPSYQNSGANAYKPSLDNIHQLCAAFDHPQKALQFIHVAGTNGKGSTCSMLASILTDAGYKVGLFTSPHISDFKERIRINGDKVNEAFIIATTNQIKNAKLDFEPSFFEISFLLSLLYFREQQTDICVIETGLGGRLDATNCITPILSLITNISLEHTQFLGNTVELIAGEKAGIIKPTIPVIIGERQTVTDLVFEKVAQQNNSNISFAEDVPVDIPASFPLLGSYQHRNYQLVVSALNALRDRFSVSDSNIISGLKNLSKNTGFMGRMQIQSREPLTIFDVSHNPAGVQETLKSIQALNNGNLFIVYGTSSDKDLHSIFNILPKSANYFLTEFSNERSAKSDNLFAFAEEYELNAKIFLSPQKALESAQNIANKEDTILVFGSFFLISDYF